MFRYFLFILALYPANNFAQALATIKQYILEKKLMDAKTAVENYLAVPENEKDADAWYFKGYVYNLLSKDTQFTIPLSNTKAIAFNSFTRCLSIIPKHRWLERDNYYPLIDIYYHFFENGRRQFEKENYELALDDFINAEKTGRFLNKNGICYKNTPFPVLDTNLIYNIATTALRAKKEKEGIFYFIKIAEAKLKDPVYLPIYQALVNYFIAIHDEIGYRKYLAIGRTLYPYNNFWVESELGMSKAGKLTSALLEVNQEKIKKDPENFDLHYAFCVDLMHVLFFSETKPRNMESLQKKMEEELLLCHQLQKSGFNTEYITAQYYHHQAMDIRQNGKSLKENEKEDFKILNEKALRNALVVLNAFEQYRYFNRNQLESYKIVTNIIIDIYSNLNRETDVLQFKEKLKTIENILPVYQTKKK